LQPYLLSLHNFFIKWKLLIIVCTALADVNILWCIVLANTYISVSIKLIVCQQMVFTVLANATTIYLSVCTVIIFWTDYHASLQFNETGTVQCHTEMKCFMLEKGKWKIAWCVTSSKALPLSVGLSGFCTMRAETTWSLHTPLIPGRPWSASSPLHRGLLGSCLSPLPEDFMESWDWNQLSYLPHTALGQPPKHLICLFVALYSSCRGRGQGLFTPTYRCKVLDSERWSHQLNITQLLFSRTVSYSHPSTWARESW
jgi:hypothetical protein